MSYRAKFENNILTLGLNVEEQLWIIIYDVRNRDSPCTSIGVKHPLFLDIANHIIATTSKIKNATSTSNPNEYGGIYINNTMLRSPLRCRMHNSTMFDVLYAVVEGVVIRVEDINYIEEGVKKDCHIICMYQNCNFTIPLLYAVIEGGFP